MKPTSPRPLTEQQEALAVRYVLGELSEAEFADFEALYSSDAAFRDSYNHWAASLDVVPDDGEPPTQLASGLAGMWRSGQAWLDRSGVGPVLRKLGVLPAVIGALLAALLVVFVTNLGVLDAPQQEPPLDRSVLVSDAGKVVAELSLNAERDELTVLVRTQPTQPEMVFELWLVGDDDVPVSLGVIDLAEQRLAVPLEPAMVTLLFGGGLVLTQEPLGGAGGAGPTGEVIGAGAFAVP